ncbi:hypothetical protein JCM11251_004973 [Rhodosporidiobolus azoricus]
MRTAFALTFLGAAASLVAAQSSCTLTCVTQAAGSTDCSAQDYGCLCQNQAFVAGVAQCVTQTCPDEISTALGLAQTACGAVGVTLDTAAIASATQGAASSSASGSSSATGAASVSSALSSAISSASSSASSAASSVQSSVSSAVSSASSVIASVTQNPSAASGSAPAASATGGGNGAGALKASGLLAGIAAAAVAVGF